MELQNKIAQAIMEMPVVDASQKLIDVFDFRREASDLAKNYKDLNTPELRAEHKKFINQMNKRYVK